MLPKHPSWIVLAVLCFTAGCRTHPRPTAAPTAPTPEQLLDQVMPPEDQMTPALLESDRVNLAFANLELAFAAKHNIAPHSDALSGPLSSDQAQEHLEAANLVLNLDKDRFQTQKDIMNLRVFTAPRALGAAQANQ